MASLGRFGGLGIVACTLGCGLVLDTGATGRRTDGAFTDGGSARSDGDLADGEVGTDGAPPPECDESSDCEPIHGPAPCGGAWDCTAEGYCGVSCPGCTDPDRDGFGPESTCIGGDCDPTDFWVRGEAVETCEDEYSGPPGTAGVGACTPATRECTGGTWTECIGEIVPSGETCNGIDDDCNGTIDDPPPLSCGLLDACATSVPACTSTSAASCGALPVSTDLTDDATCDGIDDNCDGFVDEDCTRCVYVSASAPHDMPVTPTDPSTPFRTIQAAIAHATTIPTKRVCVLADPGCAPASHAGPVQMAPGISVHGNYNPTSGRPCDGPIQTTIESGTSVSVEFPPEVVGPAITELANMRVRYGATGSSIAAIRVNGATGVRLSNVVTVPPPPSLPMEAVGIDVSGGGEAVVSRSIVDVWRATTRAIGIRAVGSRVVVRENCAEFDTDGRCAARCDFDGAPGIHARGGFGAMDPAGITTGIWLEDALGSVVDRTRVCGSASQGTGAAVRITGGASNVVVTRNVLRGTGGASGTYGVYMDACRGTPARIVDNFDVTAEGPALGSPPPAEGVYAGLGCHAVIADNISIAGALEGAGIGAGVHCTAGSQCYVMGNQIDGNRTPSLTSTFAVGLRCDANSCLRVEKNSIRGGRGIDVVGIRVEGSRATLDDNLVVGGCGSASAVGMDIAGSPVRVTNSIVQAGTCDGAAIVMGGFIAMNVQVSRPGAEPDVNSNLLDGAGLTSPCTSNALFLEPGSGGPLPSGIYRNNVLVAGSCDTRAHVVEYGTDADPRTFQHNAFDDALRLTYVDEGTMPIHAPDEVDGLTDMIAIGTLGTGCDYTYPMSPFRPELPMTSPCIDQGMQHGAPEDDMYDTARDDMLPDIGPVELP